MSRCRPFLAAFGAIVLLLGTLPAAPPTAAQPASETVTSLADSGSCPSPTTCTLRGALATHAAIIDVSVTGTIRLNSPLAVSDDVAIRGPGAASLTVSGEDATRILLIDAGLQVTL